MHLLFIYKGHGSNLETHTGLFLSSAHLSLNVGLKHQTFLGWKVIFSPERIDLFICANADLSVFDTTPILHASKCEPVQLYFSFN